MQQDRKLITFLLLGVFFCYPVWAEVTVKGLHLKPTLSQDWTQLGFLAQNSGDEEEKITIKTVVGPIESASEYSAEISIPAKCSWEMTYPVFAPQVTSEDGRPLKRRFEATIYVNQGGALLHRERILAPLLKSQPFRFLNEGFEKPKEKWSVDGLWNDRKWLERHGNINLDLKERKLSGRSSNLAFPFIENHLENRIVVLESLTSLKPLNSSKLLNWIEKGGILIISEKEIERHPLHEILSFFPVQECWSAPGKKGKPFKSVLHHFPTPWKDWNFKGDHLGNWREFGHGTVLVSKVPIRELLGEKIITWQDITSSFRNPHPPQLWQEGGGKEWIQSELQQVMGSGVWSRNLVGFYLASLFVLAVALAQLPVMRNRRELRWLLWCGLSVLWCGGGFVFHLLNTDPSTRMNSIEIFFKKTGTPKADSIGLSTWRSGSKRRMDLQLEGYRWFLDGSQSTSFGSEHWGPKNWEVRPGESKVLSWQRKELTLPFPDPSLEFSREPKLSIPDPLVGQQAWLVLNNHIWAIEALKGHQTLTRSSRTTVDEHQGPMESLLKTWTKEKNTNPATSRPRAWLFLKNPDIISSFPFPDNVVSQEEQWLWFSFPTSVNDGKILKGGKLSRVKENKPSDSKDTFPIALALP